MKMKKEMILSVKKAFALLLTAGITASALAFNAMPCFAKESGDYEYAVISETEKTCAVTKYIGSSEEITVPSEIEGYTVKKIGYLSSSFGAYDYGAFENLTNIKEVSIPSTVAEIGRHAFKGCSSLICVSIPDSVNTVGNGAFLCCSSLAKVAIPDSVSKIGDYAFGYTEKYNESLQANAPEKIPNFTVCGSKGSAAEEYALKANFNFMDITNAMLDVKSGIIACAESDLSFPKGSALNTEAVNENGMHGYKIALTVDGAEVQPYGELTVKIPVSAIPAAEKSELYRKTEQGVEKMSFTVESGCAVFKTDALGVFVFKEIVLDGTAVIGDVNGDGKVTAVDARWALQCAAKKRTLTAKQFALADINGDGKISAVDARQILKKAAGKS